MESTLQSPKTKTATAVTSEGLLNAWQGHRRLTRRTIEAFPDDKFSTYSVGGMRPFSAMTLEMIEMAAPGINGIVTGVWSSADEMQHNRAEGAALSKQEILQRWDEITALIDSQWPLIPENRFEETDLAFGRWQMPIDGLVLYFIDNEIHHRGQAYVYLRSLGIEPPPFWER